MIEAADLFMLRRGEAGQEITWKVFADLEGKVNKGVDWTRPCRIIRLMKLSNSYRLSFLKNSLRFLSQRLLMK